MTTHLPRLVVLAGLLGLGVLAAGSLAASATTSVVAFAPTDDTYVDSTLPEVGFAPALEGRVDSVPLRHAYLRFEVEGLTSPVSRATLRIYSRTAHFLGFEVRAVAETTWMEETLTYANAPAFSETVTASSGAIAMGTWAEIDVTPLVAGNGPVAFALTTSSVTQLPLAMKESGEVLTPQLIVETESPSSTETTTPPTDTTTPTDTTAPTETTPTESTPTETTPTETTPTETTPTETTPTETTPTETTPTETTPTETTPTETTPTESTPTETTPTETTPTETTPTETTPTESTPTETTPTETTPTETTPPPDTSPPAAPTGLAVTGVTATSVSISWDSASDDTGVTGYGVYLGDTLSGSTTETTFTLTELMCESSYSVAVDAHDAAGNQSERSPALTVTTGECPDLLAPTMPGNLRAVEATASTVTVAWEPSSDNVAVTGYRVYRDGTFIAATDLPTYTFDGLTCGLGYELSVDAYDAAGNVSTEATVTASTAACQTEHPVIAIAGDISGNGTGDSATAALLDSLQPTAVLTAGDNAYIEGSLAQYITYYEPTWGRHMARTFPTPGNHEYLTTNASGYFSYFGERAGPVGKGWYSYDIGDWHLIALNSEVDHDGTSEQVTWLKNDLAASNAKCVLAYWHKPRFSAGNYGDNAAFQPFWNVLYAADADVVVNGHDHNYQRYAPMTPNGGRDYARGIREFVVGTGGRSHYGLRTDARREAADATSFGVLKFTLRPDSYEWAFVAEAGKTYTDTGTGACH